MKFLEMLQTRFGRIKIEAEDIFYHPINSDKDAYDCSRRSDDLVRHIDEVSKEVGNDVGNWNGNLMARNVLYGIKVGTGDLRDRLTRHMSRARDPWVSPKAKCGKAQAVLRRDQCGGVHRVEEVHHTLPQGLALL